MDPSIYFFGLVSGKFISYPQDHSDDILNNAIKKVKNVSQVILHRKDNLLYYCYLRRIDGNSMFGIGLCLDFIYTDMEFLFNTFDTIYADLIKEGTLLKLDAKAQILWASSNLSSNTVIIHEYSKKLIDLIASKKRSTAALPPIDFSISINDCIELSLENDKNSILSAIKRYSNLYIVKTDSEIERITSFKNLLRSKDQEIAKIKREIKQKEHQIKELSKTLHEEKNKKEKRVWPYWLTITILFFLLSVSLYMIWNDSHLNYQIHKFFSL